MNYQIICGDALQTLKTLPSSSVQTCVTSPPYFGLRDYGTAEWEGGDPECDHSTGKKARNDGGVGGRNGPTSQAQDGGELFYRDVCRKCGARRVDNQIGLEETPEAYVAKLVDVFREVRRVLRDDGTLWLNLGDSYASNTKGTGGTKSLSGGGTLRPNGRSQPQMGAYKVNHGVKEKDLIGIPWAVAFALRADGWYLRSDIIWAKPNPMPESVTDRPTKAHEYIFLLSKSREYYYDAEAIKEPSITHAGLSWEQRKAIGASGQNNEGVSWRKDVSIASAGTLGDGNTRNKRSVWALGTEPYSDAHFATMPTKLVEPCILAGSSAYGACAKCGSPWARVVEREAERYNAREGVAQRLRNQGASNGGTEKVTLGVTEHVKRTTIGWQPTCTCNCADVVPCTVLDCFSGASTTGLVALKHGRKYIGLELNPAYIEMSHKRLLGVAAQQRLFEATP